MQGTLATAIVESDRAVMHRPLGDVLPTAAADHDALGSREAFSCRFGNDSINRYHHAEMNTVRFV